jgi:hypothetical protein
MVWVNPDADAEPAFEPNTQGKRHFWRLVGNPPVHENNHPLER